MIPSLFIERGRCLPLLCDQVVVVYPCCDVPVLYLATGDVDPLASVLGKRPALIKHSSQACKLLKCRALILQTSNLVHIHFHGELVADKIDKFFAMLDCTEAIKHIPLRYFNWCQRLLLHHVVREKILFSIARKVSNCGPQL